MTKLYIDAITEIQNKKVPFKRPKSTDQSDHIYSVIAKSKNLKKKFKEGYG